MIVCGAKSVRLYAWEEFLYADQYRVDTFVGIAFRDFV